MTCANTLTYFFQRSTECTDKSAAVQPSNDGHDIATRSPGDSMSALDDQSQPQTIAAAPPKKSPAERPQAVTSPVPAPPTKTPAERPQAVTSPDPAPPTKQPAERPRAVTSPAPATPTKSPAERPRAITSSAPPTKSTVEHQIELDNSSVSTSPIHIDEESDDESQDSSIDVSPVNEILARATSIERETHEESSNEEIEQQDKKRQDVIYEDDVNIPLAPIQHDSYYRVLPGEMTSESINQKLVLCWATKAQLGLGPRHGKYGWEPAIVREIVSSLRRFT